MSYRTPLRPEKFQKCWPYQILAPCVATDVLLHVLNPGSPGCWLLLKFRPRCNLALPNHGRPLLLLQIHCKQRDIGWGNAADPAGLAQSGWLDFSEFLARFGSKAPNSFVIHPLGDGFSFSPFGPGDRVLLPADVSLVLEIGLHLLPRLPTKLAQECLREVLEGKVGAPEELIQAQTIELQGPHGFLNLLHCFEFRFCAGPMPG